MSTNQRCPTCNSSDQAKYWCATWRTAPSAVPHALQDPKAGKICEKCTDPWHESAAPAPKGAAFSTDDETLHFMDREYAHGASFGWNAAESGMPKDEFNAILSRRAGDSAPSAPPSQPQRADVAGIPKGKMIIKGTTERTVGTGQLKGYTETSPGVFQGPELAAGVPVTGERTPKEKRND